MGPKRIIAFIGALLILTGVEVPSLLAGQKNKQEVPPPDQVGEVLNHGVRATPNDGSLPPPELQRRNPRYEVVTGDVISIQFPYTPKFDQTATVGPDGYITLRDARSIHIAGQTVPEIRKDIQQAYGKILRNPAVSVTLKQFQTPYFLALGQVHKPGKYDLYGPTTVAEAVAMAGGFTGKGKRNDVILFRRVSDNWVSATKVNLKHMLTTKNLAEDLQLQPGDMIFVPKNKLSKIKPFIPLPSLAYYLH